MNKTLKVLLAVVLFAVVLALATGVNAATASEIAKIPTSDSDETPKYMTEEVKQGVTTYTLKANYDEEGEIVVEGPANLVLNANVTKATVKTTGEVDISGTGTLVAVENSGTLVVKSTGVITELNNAGTATIDTGANKVANVVNTGKMEAKEAVTGKIENSGALTIAADMAVEMTSGATLAVANAVTVSNLTYKPESLANNYGEYTTLDEEGNDDATIYLPKKDVKVSIVITDDKDKEVTTLEAGKDYTLEVKASYGDIALNADDAKIEIAENPDLTLTGTTLRVASALAGKEIEATVAFNGVNTTVTLGAAAPVDPENPDDENKDPEVPGDENNGEENKEPDNKNDNELDPDTPNTGDHIIPATALLAVVVVANVVYFAKMKRN